MKISIRIMAHPKRREWAEELSEKLECPIIWDEKNNVWDTCRRSWLSALEEDSDYCLVIQDDAVLCTNFDEKLIELLFDNQFPAYQLYYGNDKRKKLKDSIIKGFKWGEMMWGVAIMLRTELVGEMIRFGDSHPAWQDDVKIKHFLRSKGIKTAFPVPGLVDHRPISENPTLTECVDFDKKSPVWLG